MKEEIEAEIEVLRKQAQESSERYRQSGIALSATVITLSVGAIYFIQRVGQSGFLLAGFVIPISLSICYQLLHFLAGQAHSRAQDAWASVHEVIHRFLTGKDNAVALKVQCAVNRSLKYRWRAYGLSVWEDIFCSSSVAAFLILMAAEVWYLGNKAIAVIPLLAVMIVAVVSFWEVLCSKFSFLKKIPLYGIPFSESFDSWDRPDGKSSPQKEDASSEKEDDEKR